MEHIYDMIVIGGGPGGYTAALYATRAGLDTLVLEKLSAGGQMAQTTQIDNYPGFDEGIDGFALGEKMQAGAERFGAKTELAEVQAVHLTEQPRRVETSEGTFLARTVVIATGAGHRPLGIEREAQLTPVRAWLTARPATACSSAAKRSPLSAAAIRRQPTRCSCPASAKR